MTGRRHGAARIREYATVSWLFASLLCLAPAAAAQGPAAQVELVGNELDLESGAVRLFMATVMDAAGNPVTSYDGLVNFSQTAGTGSVTGLGDQTAVAGVAAATLTGDVAGPVTIQATATGIASNELSFNVVPGVAVKLVFGQQPTDTAEGATMTPAVTVEILDASDNLTNSTDSVTVAIGNNPSGGTLSGTTTVAAVAGVATFSDLSIDIAGIGYTLTASSVPLAGATSDSFDITGDGGGGFNTVTMWLGLRNSDDMQTLPDLEVRIYAQAETDLGNYLGRGLVRCITGLVRNPNKAVLVQVDLESPVNTTEPVKLIPFVRIGTNDDESRCVMPGSGAHFNATGIRGYYDSLSYPSRITDTDVTLYLHRDGTLSTTAPTLARRAYRDSAGINFFGKCAQAEIDADLCMLNGKNPFKRIGVWSE